MTLRALEFYSGIGAFAQAARVLDIDVVAAFDQSQHANVTYQANYQQQPCDRNLDSIRSSFIPPGDLWWMSPPCTPFSRRGKQKDQTDSRARSFLHLIDLMAEKSPHYILVENVQGFLGSAVHTLLIEKLTASGYGTAQFSLCPTMFGVPMLRPRVFIVASKDGSIRMPAAPACLEESD